MDTHVVLWWSASELNKLSPGAAAAIVDADEIAISSISWYEIAWLAHHNRIGAATPLRAWLEIIAAQVRTIAITPAISATAVALPDSFPGDPMDRIIYATAVEHGWSLVTKDERMRSHTSPRKITIW